MEELDLKSISEVVSKKLAEPIVFIKAEPVGKGFHATGYKLLTAEGKAFFLKKITATKAGLEHPERKLSSVLIGHNMATRAGQKPRPLGLILETDGKMTNLPDISLGTNVFHLQEFEPEGTSYFSILENSKDKTAVDERDIQTTSSVVDVIASIHALKYPSKDSDQLRALYMDGLRGELVHPEITLTLMHELDEDHPVIPPSKQGEYVGLYLQLIHTWKGRSDRLRALHGDLWGANVFVRKDGTSWIIDFSRIPWGDPGIDIGRWMGQYVWFYILTKNKYFKELGELFLETYAKKTGDKEIRKAASLGYIFSGFIYPVFFDKEDISVRKKMFEHAREILKKSEFFWPEIK